jgi:hypothetical protein
MTTERTTTMTTYRAENPKWVERKRAEIIEGGTTTIVLLERTSFGWKLRSWTRVLGQPNIQAEGTPVFEQTYGDAQSAIADYRQLCVEAIEHPKEFKDETDRRVARELQKAINGAAAEEEAARVREQTEHSGRTVTKAGVAKNGGNK